MEEGNGGGVMDQATRDALDQSLRILLSTELTENEGGPVAGSDLSRTRQASDPELTEAQSPLTPLLWDGYGYRRNTDGRVLTDAFGEELPPQPIGIGWTIWSVSQRWILEDEYRLDRCGYCVDCYGDADGQPVFVCVEVSSGRVRAVRRLSIGIDDVARAEPTDSFQTSKLKKSLFDALGTRSPYQLHCSKGWLEEVVVGLVGGPMAHTWMEQRGR